MIELVFSDSATGSLRMAKGLGAGEHIGGVKVVISNDGEIISEEPYTPPPYTGPVMEGSSEDVLGIWLLADIGDISNLDNWESRIALWHQINEEHDDEDDWTENYAKQLQTFTRRLDDATANGVPIRIWWSDTPGDACGYYWAMHRLRNAKGPIYSVHIPCLLKHDEKTQYTNGTGSLHPEQFPILAEQAHLIEQWEKDAIAGKWNELMRENSRLRAVVNGEVCSVPADFYDYYLWDNIPYDGEECRIIDIIGRTLGRGPRGVGDWWYAQRIRALLDEGELRIVEHKKRFYHCTVSNMV